MIMGPVDERNGIGSWTDETLRLHDCKNKCVHSNSGLSNNYDKNLHHNHYSNGVLKTKQDAFPSQYSNHTRPCEYNNNDLSLPGLAVPNNIGPHKRPNPIIDVHSWVKNMNKTSYKMRACTMQDETNPTQHYLLGPIMNSMNTPQLDPIIDVYYWVRRTELLSQNVEYVKCIDSHEKYDVHSHPMIVHRKTKRKKKSRNVYHWIDDLGTSLETESSVIDSDLQTNVVCLPNKLMPNFHELYGNVTIKISPGYLTDPITDVYAWVKRVESLLQKDDHPKLNMVNDNIYQFDYNYHPSLKLSNTFSVLSCIMDDDHTHSLTPCDTSMHKLLTRPGADSALPSGVYGRLDRYNRDERHLDATVTTGPGYQIDPIIDTYAWVRNVESLLQRDDHDSEMSMMDGNVYQFDYNYDPSLQLSKRLSVLSCIMDGDYSDSLTPGDTSLPSRPDADSALPSDVTSRDKMSHPKLTMAHVNARSARNKSQSLRDQIVDYDLDLFFVTETWLIDGNADDDATVKSIKPPSYEYVCANRNERQGGSLGAFFKSNLKFKKLEPPKVNLGNETPSSIKTMEIMETLLYTKDKQIRLICMYRPDSSPVKQYPMSQFYDEFSELMTHYNLCDDEIIIFGDMNFHVNKPDKPDVKKFLDIIESNNLNQHIHEPTHEYGNTLDLLITRQSSNLVYNACVGERISDHDCVRWNLNLLKPERPKKTVRFRKMKQIDMDEFKKDLGESLQRADECSTICDMIDIYNTSLKTTLDKHAPEKIKEIVVRDPTPWMSDDVLIEKRKRRKLEKKMKRTRLEVDKIAFKEQKNKVNNLVDGKKSEYYKTLIDDNKENPRGLFRAINAALHRRQDTPLPPHSSKAEVVNDFGEFFNDKIDNIRNNLDAEAMAKHVVTSPEVKKFTSSLHEFRLLSEDEVRELVRKSPTKHCELDPMPTWLVKDCLEEILPILTRIINLSLQMGDVPLSLKHAIIKPLLKKMGLELINKKYRPVSNLTYISKLIERAVVAQLLDHLKDNNLMDIYQSAYRMFHSTETALLKVRNDILMEMDKRNTVMLVLLDLSAAFDTIDHNILLNRLEKRCGITGTALRWFNSYLTGRSQSVSIDGIQSKLKPLKYGVPQGSVLGPILFTIYTSTISDILADDDLSYHCFADDTQLYLGFSPCDINSQNHARNQLDLCLRKVKNFMLENRLKLNDDKTEFILIGTKYWLSKVQFDNIDIGNTSIKAVDKARNLGIIFDKEMGLESQVKNVCKKGYGNLRNLASIRRSLDESTAKIAAHAFVTSHLDYGNSLYYGLYKYQTDKLQLLQNSAARVVKKKRKFDHISEDLEKMHWLPIIARIEFKLLLLTWKSLHDQGPIYLTDLLKKHNRNALRLPYKQSLLIPKTNLVTCGDRAFEVAAPTLWNSLPTHIRFSDKLTTFKSKLKTHLFKKYYPDSVQV